MHKMLYMLYNCYITYITVICPSLILISSVEGEF